VTAGKSEGLIKFGDESIRRWRYWNGQREERADNYQRSVMEVLESKRTFKPALILTSGGLFSEFWRAEVEEYERVKSHRLKANQCKRTLRNSEEKRTKGTEKWVWSGDRRNRREQRAERKPGILNDVDEEWKKKKKKKKTRSGRRCYLYPGNHLVAYLGQMAAGRGTRIEIGGKYNWRKSKMRILWSLGERTTEGV
jgi:hypothetical protein